MSKKKLNLKSLEVKSFVTSMEENKEATAKGGAPPLITQPPCFVQTIGGTACVSKVIICFTGNLRCPTQAICPTELICPSKPFCPSQVGCPTDFCTFDPF